MMTDNLVESNCEIPMQCELMDKNENRDMVTNVLRDAKFLRFITTFTGTGSGHLFLTMVLLQNYC
jgi:hypothetical protein